MCEDACGVVRSCAKSPFFFYFSSDLFRPPLSSSVCACARACMFFSPPHGAERAPGYPDRQEPMTHSFILSVFGRFVGVWVCIRV